MPPEPLPPEEFNKHYDAIHEFIAEQLGDDPPRVKVHAIACILVTEAITLFKLYANAKYAAVMLYNAADKMAVESRNPD